MLIKLFGAVLLMATASALPIESHFAEDLGYIDGKVVD